VHFVASFYGNKRCILLRPFIRVLSNLFRVDSLDISQNVCPLYGGIVGANIGSFVFFRDTMAKQQIFGHLESFFGVLQLVMPFMKFQV